MDRAPNAAEEARPPTALGSERPGEAVLCVMIFIDKGEHCYSVERADVLHDDDCATQRAVGCTCRPHVVLYTETGAYVIREGESSYKLQPH